MYNNLGLEHANTEKNSVLSKILLSREDALGIIYERLGDLTT